MSARSIACAYEVDGILHYCVANMPGAVPVTATRALTNATMPYVRRLAEGVDAVLEADPALAKSVNVRDGEIVYEPVGQGLRRGGARGGVVRARRSAQVSGGASSCSRGSLRAPTGPAMSSPSSRRSCRKGPMSTGDSSPSASAPMI